MGLLPDRWSRGDIHALAGGQRGLVTHAELLALGLSGSAVARAVKLGILHQVHRGVYSLLPLHALPELAREQAAVMALGRGAVVAGDSAAAIWGLRVFPADFVDLLIIGRDCRSRSAIRVRQVGAIDRHDVRKHKGLPVTAPARTLLDIAASLSDRELERALDEALVRRLMRLSEASAMLKRHPRRRGTARLRALVSEDRATTMTRSEAEERFLLLIRKAALPEPQVNARHLAMELDFLWREKRLAIEIDGHTYHSSQVALERDHRRDVRLQAAGVLVMRFTWRQVRDRPEEVVAQVAAALGRGVSAA